MRVPVWIWPVGRTHEDIDQAFRWESSPACAQNAILFDTLHAEIFHVYNKDTTVCKL